TSLNVGFDGTGALTVEDQAVAAASHMFVGFNADSVDNTLLVDAAMLTVLQDLTIGYAGAASAIVEDGGLLDVGYLNLAMLSTATADLTVTGAGSEVVAVYLTLGQFGGTATLTVSDGGSIELGNDVSAIADAIHVGGAGFLQGAGTVNADV